MEKKEQTMRAEWANDPVHPNGHIYAKDGAQPHLEDSLAAATPAAATANRKRTWCASNRDKGEGSSTRNWQPDNRSSYGSYGSYGHGGGGSGSTGNRQRQPDSWSANHGGSGSGSGSGRSSSRSLAWKAGGSGGSYEPAGKYKRGERDGGGGFPGRGGSRFN